LRAGSTLLSNQAAASPDDWYQNYGLDRDPFAEGGVQGLFYPGGARQETVEQLQHLARFADSVLLVTGVAGSGKSATLRHFVAQCAADVRHCVIEAALLDGAEQFLRRILGGFGIETEGAPELERDLQRLELFSEMCHRDSIKVWLVIDDAQDLHQSVVAMLPQLLQRMAGSLRLICFAQPAWRQALSERLSDSVSVHVIALEPLDRGETYAYIHYRLKTAGLEAEPPLNAHEFEQIQQQSAGLPGRINALTRQVLIDAVGVVQQPLSGLPMWHFAAIAATLVLLLALYIWASFGEPDPGQPTPGVAAITAPAEPLILDDSVEALQEVAIAGPERLERATARRQPEAASIPRDTVDGAVAGSALPPGEIVREQAPEIEPKPAPAVAPAVAPAKVPEPAAPVTTAAQPAATTPGAMSDDERHLLGLDGATLVLQILSSSDQKQVAAFTARQKIELRQYRKVRDGVLWYSLVHGEFRDHAAAAAAAEALGQQIPGTKPWVRRVDGIQQEIRGSRGP
jgi:DamX protein